MPSMLVSYAKPPVMRIKFLKGLMLTRFFAAHLRMLKLVEQLLNDFFFHFYIKTKFCSFNIKFQSQQDLVDTSVKVFVGLIPRAYV